MSKEYRCECGAVFDTTAKFAAHCRYCKVRALSCNRDFVAAELIRKQQLYKMRINAGQANRKKAEQNQRRSAQEWISEQHICERCGQVMTIKYGSGRFCSRKCANSKPHSVDSIEKIRKGVLKRVEENKKLGKQRVYTSHKKEQVPNLCKICGKPVFGRVTCSAECRSEHARRLARERVIQYGGNFNTQGWKSYKQGTYDGIRFNSSWELAYYVYNKEVNNIQLKKCTDAFEYTINNKRHLYFPDFIYNETYIEIKGNVTEDAIVKMTQFPKTLKYKMLTEKDLKIELKYCRKKYGQKFWDNLYQPLT